MQSAGCGVGYKTTQSRPGASSCLCFSRVVGGELTTNTMKDFVKLQSLFLCMILAFSEQESGTCFVVWRRGFLEAAGCSSLLLSGATTHHAIFLTSVVVMLSLFPSSMPRPHTPKQVVYLVYFMFGKEIIIFFLLDIHISHCAAFPSIMPPGERDFPT